MAGKVTILLTDDSLDKACVAFNVALGAAAAEKEVAIFFTCWSLRVLRRAGRSAGRGLVPRMMDWTTRGGAARLPLSRWNFFGLGAWMMRRAMRRGHLDLVPQQIATARELGVKFYVCDKPAQLFGLGLEDLLPVVDGVVGVPSLLLWTTTSQTTLCF
ncbi:MAG: DsrE/DsrF/DrsH-like family protein [Thermaerobacter sp.]|jgi:peroxiredoxin family protein|nr:DsrE/DsrF/DrsH-like family protein [Thermaerobacter sp.]MDA8145663.1 DsrE/DsrF/DrsH-like family protein [Thermaerobacter sp.]